MAHSTILSTITIAVLILARLSIADDFTDLNSCSKASILQSNCDPIDEITTSDATIHAVNGDGDGDVVSVGNDESTYTLTHILKHGKTTITITTTQTILKTEDVKTTDSNGNDVETQTTIASITTKTSESVSVVTSYADITHTDKGGTVYVGDGTVSVGGDYGTVIVGPGSVVVGGSGEGTTATSTTSGTARKTVGNGATATNENSAPFEDQSSAGARIFLATWGACIVVMVCAGLGGLYFIF